MATVKRITTKRTETGPLAGFYKALRAAGCTFCPRCHAFMYPDHTAHVLAGAVDAHASRYVIVGGYGNVRLVDLTKDAAEYPAAA